MYARPYKDAEIQALPPHYDGVAFTDAVQNEKECVESTTQKEDAPQASADPLGISRFLGADIFRGIKFPKIGTEELLLIAAAAFLFFSRDGDKECAILILMLIFLS